MKLGQNKITGDIIYTNDYIDIIHQASKCCYNSKLAETYEEKARYIAARIKEGHESVIEHSNVVMWLCMPESLMFELNEAMGAAKHLNYKIKKVYKNEVECLIGGNIRAYKNLFRFLENQDNKVANYILELLHRLDPHMFGDFINAGIMSINKFNKFPMVGELNIKESPTDKLEVVNIDPIAGVLDWVKTVTVFNLKDILDMLTVTFLFKSISRPASMQLNRHRNAISQKSQRYVDETNAKFINPLDFKATENSNPIIDTEIFGEITLEDLAEKLIGIYGDLRKSSLAKEDARGLLIQNVETTEYVTMTFRNCIHFIMLRTDPHSQAEIRFFAENIESIFLDHIDKFAPRDLSIWSIPEYQLTECNGSVEDAYDNIDEVIDEYEESL